MSKEELEILEAITPYIHWIFWHIVVTGVLICTALIKYIIEG